MKKFRVDMLAILILFIISSFIIVKDMVLIITCNLSWTAFGFVTFLLCVGVASCCYEILEERIKR